jgi:hypothetical protein
MSPFGNKDKGKADEKQEKLEQWRLVLKAERDRLDSLSLPQLAAEVMVRAFGPGGPGADEEHVQVGQANANAGPSLYQVSGLFEADRGFTFPLPTSDDLQLLESIRRLVAEGLQELEHASLIRVQMHTAMGSFDYATTRRGRAALDGGEVERIVAERNA